MRIRAPQLPGLILLLCWLPISPGAQRPVSRASAEWRSYGGDAGGTRLSPLREINRRTVGRLRRVWTYHTGEWGQSSDYAPRDVSSPFECTPLVVDGVMYLSTPSNRIIALNAETGAELWKFDPQAGRAGRRQFMAHRGVAYWEGAARDERSAEKRILFGTFDGRLIALDARTGRPCPDFGERGVINLRAGVADAWPAAMYAVTSPPAIYRDLVIIGARVPEHPARGPRGDVRAFDVRTGRLVWEFHTVPRPGEAGHETWSAEAWKDRTGANVWSIMSVDEERGLVFLPVGSPAYDFYGGDRPGKNLFANSVVALKAETGRLVWHYQLVHHDLWDYDPPAQPVLVTVRHRGRQTPAVAQVTKMGFVFLLDRVTGEPLFPVEERPVPPSEVPGERAWPTQPVPLKPPPLVRQRALTRAEVSRVTPESRKYCMELFDHLTSVDMFTPPGLRPTLTFPGTLGGATWSGASFDERSGLLYVNVNEIGAIGMMRPEAAGAALPYRRGSKWGEYARFWDQNHLPCQEPPWGTLNAVDLHKGEIAWRVPLGVIDELEARGIRGTGAPNLGGSIVTAGGLVFIGGANDGRFRAHDARTGKELWVERLEASGHATPVTYAGRKSGKQYVAIAAGGSGYFSRSGSDVVVAFALP